MISTGSPSGFLVRKCKYCELLLRIFVEGDWNWSLIGRRQTMTSPSRYTSSLRVDVGNHHTKHLSVGDDVTGDSVTSSRNSVSSERSVVSSPLVVCYVSTPEGDNYDADRTPGLMNGRETVASPSEYDVNHRHQQHHYELQQQQKVVSRISRFISVPVTVDSDLDSSRSWSEGEGHRRPLSSDVVRLTLRSPTTTTTTACELCSVLCVIVISVIITVVYYCANKAAKHTVKYKMRAHWIIYRNITSACTPQQHQHRGSKTNPFNSFDCLYHGAR